MGSEAKKVLRSSAFLVGSQFGVQILGLFSTLVLARILSPQDYGVAAIGTLVMSFLTTTTSAGASHYIMQKEGIEDSDLDTAWTIDIILRTIVIAIVFLTAPLLSKFYGDPRIGPMLMVLSISTAFSIFMSPQLNLLRREQQLGKIAIITILAKLVGVPGTIILAITFKNYWALVLGHIFSGLTELVASYMLAPYRPRLSLANWRQQWNFSKWAMLKDTINFFNSQMDTFLVSKFFDPAKLGAYHVNKYVGMIPGAHIISPALSPLLASFAREQNNRAGLQYRFRLTYSACLSISIFISMFSFLFSESIVYIFLGKKWLDYHSLFGILSLFTVSVAFRTLASKLVMATGKIKLLSLFDILTLVLLGPALYLSRNFNIEHFASIKITLDLMFGISLLIYCSKKTIQQQLTPLLLELIFFLVIASISGALALLATNNFSYGLIKLSLGGITYAASLTTILVAIFLMGIGKNSSLRILGNQALNNSRFFSRKEL